MIPKRIWRFDVQFLRAPAYQPLGVVIWPVLIVHGTIPHSLYPSVTVALQWLRSSVALRVYWLPSVFG